MIACLANGGSVGLADVAVFVAFAIAMIMLDARRGRR